MSTKSSNASLLKEKLLTVAVPAYNVEAYIGQCLDSLFIKELLSDLEVLVIDDGGTDQTREIAKEYEKRAPGTFRVIAKKNGGHGSAVNRGIQEANGKYFKVVDGDDWVDQKGFIKLLQALKTTTADIVSTNYLWIFEGTGKKKKEIEKPFDDVKYEHVYMFTDICHMLYIKMHSMTIRTSILKEHNIQLDEHCFYVDTEFITYPIPYINTIMFMEESVYMYRVGLSEQSVNIKNMQKNIKNHMRVINSLLDFYDSTFNNKIMDARQTYVMQIINRTIASQFKIYLSFKPQIKIKRELKAFDLSIKNRNSTLYKAQKKPTVWLLRKSDFWLYWPIAYVANWRLL